MRLQAWSTAPERQRVGNNLHPRYNTQPTPNQGANSCCLEKYGNQQGDVYLLAQPVEQLKNVAIARTKHKRDKSNG